MADDVAELNPSLIMAASLIYMSSIDGTIAQQEWGQLKTVVGGDDDLLEAGLDYVPRHSARQVSSGRFSYVKCRTKKMCVAKRL